MQIYMATLLDYFCNNKYEITREDFEMLRQEYLFIMKIVWINEKYGMILDNYYELISEMRNLEHKFLEQEDRNEMVILGQKSIVMFNRKLSNLLCSVRMYIDQTQHDLSILDIKECSKDNFHEFTSEQYDEYVGYQIMELLRNYMQHQGLIIEGVTYIKPFFQDIDYFKVTIDLDYKRLKSIEKYEKKILLDNVLKNSGAKNFNLLWFLDEYILGLSKVHEKLMKQLSEKITFAQNRINNILENYYTNIDIPDEIGIFGLNQDFLLQYSYVKKVAECMPKLYNCYEQKKYIRSVDCITGNFQKTSIRYKM